MKKIKNFSLFSNAGIGEYGTNNIAFDLGGERYEVETVVANELLEERAEVFRDNYPEANMICGSIVDSAINDEIASEFLRTSPITATFSPPCQGSSGLNVFKKDPYDFRNQLVKAIFQLFEKVKEKNTLQVGYLENVINYYTEQIPSELIHLNGGERELCNEFITTKDGKYLNYQYMILTDDKNLDNDRLFEGVKGYELDYAGRATKIGKRYAFCFNDGDLKVGSQDLVDHLRAERTKDLLLKPMKMMDYIKESMDKYGFEVDFKVVRGEEYGGCQVRQRGFLLFHKKGLKIEFPKEMYKKSTMEGYDGKRVIDAFVAMDLLKVLDEESPESQGAKCDSERYNLLLSHPYKKIDGKIYVDMSVSQQEGQEELDEWAKKGYPNDELPNLHFRLDLKDRYTVWLANTRTGESAFWNDERIHRPYKLIAVSKKDGKVERKGENWFVIEEDSKEYFKKHNIIDYVDFVTQDMKDRMGPKEWGEGKRNWQIKNVQDRKKIEADGIEYISSLLDKKGNEDKTYWFFMPIKGFETAVYRRGVLHGVQSALTTKFQYGNSNTGHPIFDRVWTPKEFMSLFGVGYVFENGEYVPSKSYVPPKGVKNIVGFQKLISEIHGEAIISTVAEQIMKSMIRQLLSQSPDVV